PQQVHEAASLDGANSFQRLWHVSLPLLSPITFFLAITGVLSAAQAFDLISIMTGGGPGTSSSTLSWMIYDEAFQNFDIGRASGAFRSIPCSTSGSPRRRPWWALRPLMRRPRSRAQPMSRPGRLLAALSGADASSGPWASCTGPEGSRSH